MLEPDFCSFPEFIGDVKGLIYNPYENELIVSARGFDFNYVIGLDDFSVYQSTEVIDAHVLNIYPELLVMEDGYIKDYALSSGDPAHVSLITRPLLYGTEHIKKLERVIVRGKFLNLVSPVEGKQGVIKLCAANDNLKIMIGSFLKV